MSTEERTIEQVIVKTHQTLYAKIPPGVTITFETPLENAKKPVLHSDPAVVCPAPNHTPFYLALLLVVILAGVAVALYRRIKVLEGGTNVSSALPPESIPP